MRPISGLLALSTNKVVAIGLSQMFGADLIIAASLRLISFDMRKTRMFVKFFFFRNIVFNTKKS